MNRSILKEINPEYWKDWCWSWSSNTLATWCEEPTHWKRLGCWERLKVGGKGDDRGWDGWMASLTQQTWVWLSSGSWWWTGRPDVMQSVRSQRVRHDWSNLAAAACPLSWWCHLTISSSVVPFSSHLQSFPASGSFPMSWFFNTGGQNIGVSASASVLPMNIQSWFPFGLTSLISLLSKGLSRVFSGTTVQKHQFFCAQPSSQSNSHIHTWPQEKP